MILGLMLLQDKYVINLLNELSGFYGQQQKEGLLQNFQFLMNSVPHDYCETSKESFLEAFKKFTNVLNGNS